MDPDCLVRRSLLSVTFCLFGVSLKPVETRDILKDGNLVILDTSVQDSYC